jgi:predicted nuclease with TOPRIM domain
MRQKLSSDAKYALALKYYDLSEKFSSLSIRYEELAKKRGMMAKSELRKREQGVAEGATESNKDAQPWVDPKLKRRMDYAFGHYAGYKDKPEAFFKWIMNAIDHSEQNDQQHQEKFDRIDQEIEKLSNRLQQVSEQHGSVIADKFSQQLAENLSGDRPKKDISHSYFAESRLIKRTAIQEILSQSR